MKKLLCLLLTAALALGLAAPALASAYEDLEPPLWQRWGFDSLEEYLEFWDETEEEYAQEVADFLAARAEEDAYIATYDEAAHDFTPPLWSDYGYDSREAMLADWEIDEADYDQVVDDRLFEYETRDWTDEDWMAYTERQIAEAVAAQKETLGLVYDINVMLDGKAVDFGNYPPEIVNGRTMVPLGWLAAEGSGSYDGDTGGAVVARDGKTLAFTVGSTRMTVMADGTEAEVELDAAPYLNADGDEVYVPLRAAADALGYDVEWSDTYRTAVLIDADALAAKLNEDFTVLNAALAMGKDLDLTQTYSGEGELGLTVTVYDSIGGDKTYTGSVNASVLENQLFAYGAVKYDWAELMGLLLRLTGDSAAADEETRAVLDAMERGIEMIADLENGKIYLRGELFAAAFGAGDISGETWFSFDLSAMFGDMPDLKALAERNVTTLGELAVLLFDYLGAGYDPVMRYGALEEFAGMLEPVSDSHFTRDGDILTLALPLPALTGADEETGTFTFSVRMDGDKAAGVTGGVKYYTDLSAYPGGAVLVDCVFDYSALEASITGSVNVKNVTKVDFALNAVSQAAPDAVLPAAPEGALDLSALLGLAMPDIMGGAGLGIIGGADGPTAIFVG